jgi:chromosome segregation ATPase
VTRAAAYSEDELREQWAFLDALVERQAASLRTGVQDPEEVDTAVTVEYDQLLRELDQLRTRVAALERERDDLRRRLHAGERRAAAPHEPHERRPWWRRLSG